MMGKIVKHCVPCDESFAQKFGFCPNCGGALSSFEMNPVEGEIKAAEESGAAASNGSSFAVPAETAKVYESAPKPEQSFAPAVSAFSVSDTPANGSSYADTQVSTDEIVAEEFKAEDAHISQTNGSTVDTKPLAAAAAANGNGHSSAFDYQPALNAQSGSSVADDGFHVTVIEEKNSKQRNILLLGTLFLMTTLVIGGVIYSLFNKDLFVGAIDGGDFIMVPVVDDEPMEVEKEKEKPKNDKDAGGGGGGGREKPTPTSKGQLATQTEQPMIAPTVTLVKKDFELQYQASTQGKKVIKQTDEPYGDPNSKYSLSSDGTGKGGGQGSGVGMGQGSGRGTGAGSGIGSGFGDGDGNGEGNGRGDGRQGSGSTSPPPPPPKPKKVEPVGPSIGVNILSKPRPGYTDAARQNQITGTVTLRVTFTSNGKIGSISPVNGLPHGLTEQAIAAARQIQFEPAKRNGQPYTVTKQVQYSFTIY